MRTRSVLGTATVLALAAASLLAPSAAFASQETFANPVDTAQTTDFDISSVDIRYTASTLTVTSHFENYVAPDWRAAVYVLSGPESDPATVGYFVIAKTTGGVSTLDAQTYANSTSSSAAVDGVTVVKDEAAKTITATVPASKIGWSTPVYVVAVLQDSNGDSAIAAKQIDTDLVGLGPVAKGPALTSTAVTLTSPTQVYGSTPSVLVASVTPANVPGKVELVEGATIVSTAVVSNGTAVVVLPTSASSGVHAYFARFVPNDAEIFASSVSGTFPFTVVSVAKTTKTTVTLSKKSQKFKKSPAKVKVVVSGKKAVGTVTIFDGKKALKTVTLKGGKATYTLSKTLKKGKHTIKAVFTPKNVEAFKTSTSKSVKLTVKK